MAHHRKRSTASSHKIQIKSCFCFPTVRLLDAAGEKCQLSVEDVKLIHEGSNGGEFFFFRQRETVERTNMRNIRNAPAGGEDD